MVYESLNKPEIVHMSFHWYGLKVNTQCSPTYLAIESEQIIDSSRNELQRHYVTLEEVKTEALCRAPFILKF